MSSQPPYPLVKIGPTEHPVVPQKIGRLRWTLERAVHAAAIGDLDVTSLRGFLTAGPEVVHPFLAVFYPKLMPLWQFAGYGSEDEYKRSRPHPLINEETGDPAIDDEGNILFSTGEETYDPERDESPDPDQILSAFEAAFKANRLDMTKGLIDWLPFAEAKAWIRVKAAEWLDEEKDRARRRLDPPSPTDSSTSSS